MSRPQVPKFGNWESEEVPYTALFDNARKGKKGDQTHQTDHGENENKGPKASEPKTPKHERHPSPEEGEGRRSSGSPKLASESQDQVVRLRQDRRVSREESDMKKFTDSPLRGQENVGRVRNNSNSPHHHHGGGETPRRVARQGLGPDRSVNHSPLHPHSQARAGARSSGISSPSWERRSEGSHGLAPSTPGRSRLRSVTRGDDSPDRGLAVPKFGEWDETDPASAEGYSHIFNKVREEKHSETGKVPVMPTETSYSNGLKQYGNDDTKGCRCFPWGRR